MNVVSTTVLIRQYMAKHFGKWIDSQYCLYHATSCRSLDKSRKVQLFSHVLAYCQLFSLFPLDCFQPTFGFFSIFHSTFCVCVARSKKAIDGRDIFINTRVLFAVNLEAVPILT